MGARSMSALQRWRNISHVASRGIGCRQASNEAQKNRAEGLKSSILDIPTHGEDGRVISVRQFKRSQAAATALAEDDAKGDSGDLQGGYLFWNGLLKTPQRECSISRRHLPSGFMINLRAAVVPSSNVSDTDGRGDGQLFLMPDRVLHPRSQPRKEGYGFWVVCHRGMLEELQLPGKLSKHFHKVPGLVTSPSLPDQIEDQLQRRVLQELKLLAARLGSHKSPQNALDDRSKDDGAVLRKLTITEARNARLGEAICDAAIAGLLNCKLPRGISVDDTFPNTENTDGSSPEIQDNGSSVSRYPLATLFASDYRSPLVKGLGECLQAERRARYRRLAHRREATVGEGRGPTVPPAVAGDAETSPDGAMGKSPISAKERSSDLVALRAWDSPRGLLGIPLAMALKRLDLWRGNGWNDQSS